MSGGGGPEFRTLLLYWVTVYFSNVFAKYTKLSPLLYYLIFGFVYGNTGVVEHSDTMDFLGEVAITIVFMALGFEENVTRFVTGVRQAWGIAIIGAVVPFLCGFGVTLAIFPDLGLMPALMAGLAVTATAVSLTMISLQSQGLATSKAAIGIMTSAVLDDVMCLALVAIMVPIATGEAEPTASGILWVLGKCALFFIGIALLHLLFFPKIRKKGDLQKPRFAVLKHIPGLRSIGVQNMFRFDHGGQGTIAVSIVCFGVGFAATAFGFHPTIGAYMAGLILEERYFDVEPEEIPLTKGEEDVPTSEDGAALPENWSNSFEHIKEILENAAFSWFGPIFFLNLGANLIINGEIFGRIIGPALVYFAALFVGQILSAALAARFVPGGFSWAESWMIGFGMLGRAELFFVVLGICFIENEVFSEELNFSLTIAAILLDLCVPVTISLYKPYYLKMESEDEHHFDEEAVLEAIARAEKAEKSKERRLLKTTMVGLEAADGEPVLRRSVSSLSGAPGKAVSKDKVASMGATAVMSPRPPEIVKPATPINQAKPVNDGMALLGTPVTAWDDEQATVKT